MADAIQKVKRLSLAVEAAQILRMYLIDGKLAPGTRLIEGDLALDLGVSRGTVREAMRILEGEGLIELLPGHGTRVARLSEQDISEVYSLRSLLEQEAVRRLAAGATLDDIAALDGALATMFEVADRGDAQALIDSDMQFHELLWELAGHRRLAQVLEGLLSQIRVYLAINTHAYDDLSAGVADHQGILDAIRAGAGDLAATRMAAHLADASDVVVDYARQTSAGEGAAR